jgi:hypothetical protein
MDFKARLDKIGRRLGEHSDVYAPDQVIRVVCTRRWRDDEPDPRTGAERDLLEAAQQATADQIAAWCTDDARRHNWRQRWHLVVWFRDDDRPQEATFALPWRPEGQGDMRRLVLGQLTGDRQIRWPDVADADDDDGDLPPAS